MKLGFDFKWLKSDKSGMFSRKMKLKDLSSADVCAAFNHALGRIALRRHLSSAVAVLAWGWIAAVSGPLVYGDGWHNAALATKSLDEWLHDVKAVVPDLEERLNQSELKSGKSIDDIRQAAAGKAKDSAAGTASRRGGTVQNNLTPQQQMLLARKAGDCLEVLAYMDASNIFPREFPNFQLGKIGDYRKAAKQLLKAMGPTGASAVAQQLRTELMGGNNRQAFDVSITPTYHKELLEVLNDQLSSGQISIEDADALAEAAAGAKGSGTSGLAGQVLDALEKNAGLMTLLKWSANATGSRKGQIMARFQKRAATASQEELLTALASPEAQDAHKTSIVNQINKKIPEASIADLLTTLNTAPHPQIQDAAARELRRRSPTFKEIEPELPQLVTHLSSPKENISGAARQQLANAFQRAPISPCLEWLGKNDAKLTPLIWEQIRGRIDRADAARKANYVESALDNLGAANVSIATKSAALDLLKELKQATSLAPLIELLPALPRELWPKAGATLEDITGQKFGPKSGAGAAEVSESAKKWRDWLGKNAKK